MLLIIGLVVLWDVVTAGGFDDARSIQLLLQRDHVRIVPSHRNAQTGLVVRNALNPVRAVNTLGEVSALMHSIKHSVARRVATIRSDDVSRGYVAYSYMSAVDMDADPVPVNVSYDLLARVMKPPVPQIKCEGALHYGVALNILRVYDWGEGEDGGDSEGGKQQQQQQFLFNVKPPVAHMGEVSPPSEETLEQSHCRVADIIKADAVPGRVGGGEDQQQSMLVVPETATVEYMNSKGYKERRRVGQPLLACIEHVLKLGLVR